MHSRNRENGEWAFKRAAIYPCDNRRKNPLPEKIIFISEEGSESVQCSTCTFEVYIPSYISSQLVFNAAMREETESKA